MNINSPLKLLSNSLLVSGKNLVLHLFKLLSNSLLIRGKKLVLCQDDNIQFLRFSIPISLLDK